MLQEGLSHTSEFIVKECHTAKSVGSGDLPVLATPCMIAWMEHAASSAVAPYLSEGDTTVGAHVETSHLAPTPVGATVTATATLTKISGRKLHYYIELHQGDVLLGKGTHIRIIVNRARFLSKMC